MMKNQVKAQTGMKSYALFTEAATQQMEIEAACAEMLPYSDSYEHLGEVQMRVHSLEAAWEQARQARHLVVPPEDAWLLFETQVAAPQALVWDYLTHPERKADWMQMNYVTRDTPPGARTGIGSSYHCAHQAGDLRYRIVDWHPFDHFTVDALGVADLRYRQTLQIIPTEAGCLVRFCYGPPDNDPDLVAQMTPLYQQAISFMVDNLSKTIEADRAAGKVITGAQGDG
jgi:uncharacterized protein YndB with AHSA1/START domain